MAEHRNPVLHLNRFQERLLYPVVIICIITCSILILIMLYLHYIGEHVALFTSFEDHEYEWAIPWFLNVHRYNLILPVLGVVVAAMLLLTVAWAYHVTHRVIGPHERVVHELDEVLSGNQKDPIVARQGDELYEELLQRINALIKKLS